MRVRMLVGVTAAFALGGAGNAVAATTRYVVPGANGTCTQADPCSLAQANTAAVDGDEIALAAGDYPALGNVTLTHAVTVSGTSRPTLHVGTLTFAAPAGNSMRDVTVKGTGNEVLHGGGITLDRVRVTEDGLGPTAICALSTAIVRDTECLSTGNAIALKVADTSQLRNVTAAAKNQNAIQVTGASTVTIHNTIAATTLAPPTAYDIVSSDAGAHITVDHSRYREVLFVPPNPLTILDGNVGQTVAATWGTGFGGVAADGSGTIDHGSADASATDLLGNPRAGAAPDIGAYEYQPTAPVTVTGDPSAVGTDSAALTGSVNPRGLSTTWQLQWGTSTNYDQAVQAPTPLPAGTQAVPLTAGLSGLDGNTTYHYRYVATNQKGTVEGADKTFTTLGQTPVPSATPTPEPFPTPQPQPEAKPKVTIALPSAVHCRTTRTLSLKPKIAKGGTITAVSVYVKGKRIKRVTGTKARRTIKLTKLPRGRYTLEVRVTTEDGRTVKIRKRYRTCARAG